jgi:hypothetical protein
MLSAGRKVAVLVALVLLLSGGVLGFSQYRSLRDAGTTTGTVTDAGIDSHDTVVGIRGRAEATVYRPQVTYTYTVDGERYTGDTVAFGDAIRTESRERAADVRAAYAAGESVTVYYDPSDPGEAYLLPQLDFLPAGALVAAGLLLLADALTPWSRVARVVLTRLPLVLRAPERFSADHPNPVGPDNPTAILQARDRVDAPRTAPLWGWKASAVWLASGLGIVLTVLAHVRASAAPYDVAAYDDRTAWPASPSVNHACSSRAQTATTYDAWGRVTGVTAPDGTAALTNYFIRTNITASGYSRLLLTQNVDANGHLVNRFSSVRGELALVEPLAVGAGLQVEPVVLPGVAGGFGERDLPGRDGVHRGRGARVRAETQRLAALLLVVDDRAPVVFDGQPDELVGLVDRSLHLGFRNLEQPVSVLHLPTDREEVRTQLVLTVDARDVPGLAQRVEVVVDRAVREVHPPADLRGACAVEFPEEVEYLEGPRDSRERGSIGCHTATSPSRS